MFLTGKKKSNGKRRRAACFILAGVLAAGSALPVLATGNMQQMQQERNDAQEGLNEANQEAREAEANLNQAENVVSGLNEELTDLLAEITLLEADMADKEIQIEQAQADYDAAKAREEDQYEDMKKRIKYMYEKGDTEFLDVLLKVRSMSELLNKSEYIENIYQYDREKLLEFQETKRQVQEYQEQLDNEMSEMEGMRQEYDEQQVYLENTISEKRKEIANFDAQLAQAQAAAEQYSKTIALKNEQIRRAEEEERRRREEEEQRRREEEARAAQEAAAAAGGEASGGATISAGGPSSGPSGSGSAEVTKKPATTKSSGGTAAGREIADYALQFVGNPYIYGGNSLTNGSDCSGFTQSVYAHFGYSLPRTSSEQRSVGVGVDYSEAQPGDIICYPGHVALYIGNGQIVHASNSRVGIVVGSATYRSIMTVRRVIQ